MGLRDYELPTEIIRIDDSMSFVVRGISFEDITRLVAKHGPVLTLVYSRFVELKGDHGLTPEALGGIVTSLVDQFPDVVADVIGIAAEERDQIEKVKRLPIGIQLDAIDKIVRLTFSGDAELKKVVETVTRMAQGVQGAMTRLGAPTASGGGSGSFASR